MQFLKYILFGFVLLSMSCSKEAGSSNANAAAGSGGKAGSLARFAIVGNHLYALDGADIVSYDISQPGTPQFKGRVSVGFDIETIYPYSNMLFVGAQTGMYAYSLSNPDKPQQLSRVSHLRSCDPVVVQGNFAYVTLLGGGPCGGGDQLHVYNVSNPVVPQLIRSLPIFNPYGLGVLDEGLFVTVPGGIKLFSLAQPDNPVFVKDIAETTATDVIPYQQTLIVQLKKGAAFYDISSVLNPVFQGRITQ